MKTKHKIFIGVIVAVCIAVTAVVIICMSGRNDDDGLAVFEAQFGKYTDYVDSLRTSGSFAPDTTQVAFTLYQDTTQARRIKEYFQLDSLYPADADTWTKALAIGRFVADNIPHDNQQNYPEEVNAIGLWEYTQTVAPAFNCRLHSILTFELLLAAGIPARFVTCLPQDNNDCDCHVVNEVWLPETGRWAMLDTDERYYVTDKDGNLLSMRDIREHYISGEQMLMWQNFATPIDKAHYYYAYLAKNTYWFSCWGSLSYSQEDLDYPDVVRDRYISLLPTGFMPDIIGGGSTVTTDADKFWSEPTMR
ncbi:MAG: transglutaminase domain-containing protein [Paludibacteraceae bacterium]|nr:transglutaminase domain-containing protein [Paludibacteraceae bacterium]